MSWEKFNSKQNPVEHNVAEQFISRIFLSQSPIQFLDGKYNNKKLLDFGCGTGRNIPFFIALKFNIIGVDVNETLINKLASKYRSASFLRECSNELPFKSSTFDYIVACNSIYYINKAEDNVESKLREFIRVARPDGRIIFSMIGAKHSIVKNGTEIGENKIQIKNDHLKFRQGLTVEVYNKKSPNRGFNLLQIDHEGEIIETCGDDCRHLHYFVTTPK